MIALLAIKKALHKTWVWLKHNWMAPFIVIYTVILWILFRNKDKAREVLEVRAQSYKDQIDAINKSHKEEIEKRDEYYNDPDTLAKMIGKRFGFDYTEK